MTQVGIQQVKTLGELIAVNEAMVEVFEFVTRAAPHKTTVTIHGESGTGKELIAKAIHNLSPRKQKPFVAINCGAIPEHLLESELFGHRKGAFTDATRDKLGLFEEANGGTVFLDEIGELPVHLQVKLLRVLQENQIRPVGGNEIIPIDIRVIAATLRDLNEDIIDGRFRDDLFYRLNVISIKIPPLRERVDDIPVLIDFFMKRNQNDLDLAVSGIEEDAMKLLLAYDWPGNVRELENCIERSMILSDTDKINIESLPGRLRESSTVPTKVASNTSLSIKQHTKLLETDLIRKALAKTNGNRTHAAKLLEISHRTLLYKLKEYDLHDL